MNEVPVFVPRVRLNPESPGDLPEYHELCEASCRVQLVHGLRALGPGARITTKIAERQLLHDSKLWKLDPFVRGQAIRDALNNLTHQRLWRYKKRDLDHDDQSAVRDTWDPARYVESNTGPGAIAPNRDTGPGFTSSGIEPYPRCLVHVSKGVRETTPELYEPQTEAERAAADLLDPTNPVHGVRGSILPELDFNTVLPEGAWMDATADRRILDCSLEEFREHVPQLREFSDTEFMLVADSIVKYLEV